MNYEAYLKSKKLKANAPKEKHISMAHRVAYLLDDAADLRKQFKQMDKEAAKQGMKPEAHPEFKTLYQRTLERDKTAALIIKDHQNILEQPQPMPSNMELIKPYAERFERGYRKNKGPIPQFSKIQCLNY